MNITTLIEEIGDWRADVSVESEQRLVRNVALTGQESRNGYRYSESALQAAAVLYEQKPVFLDHAPDKSRPQERSTRDLVGSIVNARYAEGRVRGDIRVLDTDSGRTFLALAESDTPGVGMSHVVLAERNADGTIVETIRDVISVDAVVGPATTRTFRESAETEGASEQAESSSAKPATGDESAATAGAIEELREQLSELEAERDALLARLNESEGRLEELSRRNAIAAELRSAALPEYAVTDVFLEQLGRTAEAAERQRLIEERQTLIAGAAQVRPQSRERNGVTRGTGDDAAFVTAIRAGRTALTGW